MEDIGEEVVSIILPSKVSFQPTPRRQTMKQEKDNKEERNKLKASKKDLFDAKGKGKEKKDGTARDRGISISSDESEDGTQGQGDDPSDSDPLSSDNESDNGSENETNIDQPSTSTQQINANSPVYMSSGNEDEEFEPDYDRIKLEIKQE